MKTIEEISENLISLQNNLTNTEEIKQIKNLIYLLTLMKNIFQFILDLNDNESRVKKLSFEHFISKYNFGSLFEINEVSKYKLSYFMLQKCIQFIGDEILLILKQKISKINLFHNKTEKRSLKLKNLSIFVKKNYFIFLKLLKI